MPAKLETDKYTVLNARRIGGKRRDVDDVVELARGTADHLLNSGDIELASDTPARKAREAASAASRQEESEAEAASRQKESEEAAAAKAKAAEPATEAKG